MLQQVFSIFLIQTEDYNTIESEVHVCNSVTGYSWTINYMANNEDPETEGDIHYSNINGNSHDDTYSTPVYEFI